MYNPFAKKPSFAVRTGRSVMGVLDSPALTRTTIRIGNAMFLLQVADVVVTLFTKQGILAHLERGADALNAKAATYHAERQERAAHIDA